MKGFEVTFGDGSRDDGDGYGDGDSVWGTHEPVDGIVWWNLIVEFDSGMGVVGWDGGMGYWNYPGSWLALWRKPACRAKKYGLIQP